MLRCLDHASHVHHREMHSGQDLIWRLAGVQRVASVETCVQRFSLTTRVRAVVREVRHVAISVCVGLFDDGRRATDHYAADCGDHADHDSGCLHSNHPLKAKNDRVSRLTDTEAHAYKDTVALESDCVNPVSRLRWGEMFSVDQLVQQSPMRVGGVFEVLLCFLCRLQIPLDVEAVDGVSCVVL